MIYSVKGGRALGDLPRDLDSIKTTQTADLAQHSALAYAVSGRVAAPPRV
jgi:hypothetical protein